MKRMLLLFITVTTCNAWWQETPDMYNPGQTTAALLQQQVDDPENADLSFNLGIAAQAQDKHEEANKHFSLASELYDYDDIAQRFATYFAWGDTAAQQVLELYAKGDDLSDAQLDQAIDHASRGIERYANSLTLEPDDDDAHKRRAVLQKLKELLEEKKRRREQQKEEDEKKKEEENKQDEHNKDQDKKQDQDKNQNKFDQNQQNKDKQQSDQGNQDQQSQDKKNQKKSAQDQDGQGGQGDKNQKNGQSGDTDKQQDQQGGKQEDQEPDKQGDSKQPEPAQRAGGPKEVDKGQGAQAKQSEGTANSAGAKGEQAGRPEDMAKRRSLVLLDKLDQQEATLQKHLLRKKSSQQQSQYRGYNQW